MLATGSPRRTQEETVRLRPGDLPVRPLPTTNTGIEAKTVRMRSADRLTKKLPKAISGMDGKTVRMRPLDLPVDLPGHEPEFAWLTRGGAEIPNENEIQANPRAASARLRAAQRIREATS